jgi:hypothetical protein
MPETGKRPLAPAFVRRAAEVYELPPGVVPPSDVYRYRADASQHLAVDLAALGYPGFAICAQRKSCSMLWGRPISSLDSSKRCPG